MKMGDIMVWLIFFQAIISIIELSQNGVHLCAHINMLGEYDFSDEKLQDSFGIRPPKLIAQTKVKNARNETPVK